MSVPLKPPNRAQTGARPLKNGESMKQPEFHRRYEQCPEDSKYELIGGTVYMASPARRPHGLFQIELAYLLQSYVLQTPGVEGLDNSTTILGTESEPQPDLCLRILQGHGGQTAENEEGYIVGGPEFVAEIAHSSRSLDLNQKRRDYHQNGVVEYVVLSVEDSRLYWFDFAGGGEIRPNRRGVSQSKVLPGLWLSGRALLGHDNRRSVAVLQQGINSRAHAAFVRRLERARRRHS